MVTSDLAGPLPDNVGHLGQEPTWSVGPMCLATRDAYMMLLKCVAVLEKHVGTNDPRGG